MESDSKARFHVTVIVPNLGVPNANPCTNFGVKSGLRPDFKSQLEHGLAFGIPKFYIAPYDKINHGLVNLSSNCDVKSGIRVEMHHDPFNSLVLS